MFTNLQMIFVTVKISEELMMPKSLQFHFGQKKVFKQPFMQGNINNKEKLLCLAKGQ